jgi:hypothetical protein
MVLVHGLDCFSPFFIVHLPEKGALRYDNCSVAECMRLSYSMIDGFYIIGFSMAHLGWLCASLEGVGVV